MALKPSLIETLLSILILVVLITGCQSTPVEPTVTKVEPVSANATMICSHACDTNSFSIQFYPQGGIVKGRIEVTFPEDDLYVKGDIDGRIYEDGSASGLIHLGEPGEFEYDFPWEGEIVNNVFQGTVTAEGENVWIKGFTAEY